MYFNLHERTSTYLQSNADVNQLYENIKVLGGNTSYAPSTDIQSLYNASNAIKASSPLTYKNLKVRHYLQDTGYSDTSASMSRITFDELQIDEDVTLEGFSTELKFCVSSFTNDLSAGTSVQITTAWTAGRVFTVGDEVMVRSGAGTEVATIVATSTESYIVVDELTLDHDTSYRLVCANNWDKPPFEDASYASSYNVPIYTWVITDDTGALQKAVYSESCTSCSFPAGYTKGRVVSFMSFQWYPGTIPSIGSALRQKDNYIFRYGNQFGVSLKYFTPVSGTQVTMEATSTAGICFSPDFVEEVLLDVRILANTRDAAEYHAYRAELCTLDEDGTSTLARNFKVSHYDNYAYVTSYPGSHGAPPRLYDEAWIPVSTTSFTITVITEEGTVPYTGSYVGIKAYKIKL